MTPDRPSQPFPDAARAAGHLASLYGFRRLVDAGLGWTPEVGLRYPSLRVTGVTTPGQPADQSPKYAFGRPIDPTSAGAARELARLDPAATAVYLSGPADKLAGAGGLIDRLGDLIAAAPLTVVATDDVAPVSAALGEHGLQPELAGSTRIGAGSEDRSGGLLIYDRTLAGVRQAAGPAPSSFRVVAILVVFNEQDIIGPSIQKLIDDGLGVYVIDNWSTDRTYEIVRGFEGRGLVGLERFPEAAGDTFPFVEVLRRLEALPAELGADWYIHADADERRSGPWPGVKLRDALWLVDRSGFTAVDHTVINYRPIDNGFQPGGDFESYFRHFELGRSGDLLIQVKAWKDVGPVDLARSAGHQAVFKGRRVFPYKFLVKHYPIRSQSHGEQKVFRDRGARWDKRELARGWHIQYDDVVPKQSFLRNPADLIEDLGEQTRARYLGELITGAGLSTGRMPAWALGGKTRRFLYARTRPITRTRPYQWLRRVAVAPVRLVRKSRVAGKGTL